MSEPKLEAMLLTQLLLDYQDGGETGWAAEFAWLAEHRPMRLASLRHDVERDGIREPIWLGDDGRVWDGHHRIYVAHQLGMDYVPVTHVGEESDR